MKAAMTDAFKEISKFVVDQGPKIGYYRFKQKRQVRVSLDHSLKYLFLALIVVLVYFLD